MSYGKEKELDSSSLSRLSKSQLGYRAFPLQAARAALNNAFAVPAVPLSHM